MHLKQATAMTAIKHQDELILVVKRTHFNGIDQWNGLAQVDYAHYSTLIQAHKEFLPRSQMEIDPTYKQIIPYLVFTHENKYFLMQRHAKEIQNLYEPCQLH